MKTLLGDAAGFVAWLAAWLALEVGLSAVWPNYDAHQRAFTAAIKHGSAFAPETAILLVHLASAAAACLLAGFVAARIARDRRGAPIILGLVLTSLGVVKAVTSWPLVPLWYHAAFTVLLWPMTVLGARISPPKD